MRHVRSFIVVTLVAGGLGLAIEIAVAWLVVTFWPMLAREWESLASGVLLLCILAVSAWITRRNR